MRTLILLFILISSGIFAQGEFKKHLENGNQKFNLKSYILAISDYEKAIKLIATETEQQLGSHQTLAADKKYRLEPYIKRAYCYYFTGNHTGMKGDVDRVNALDPGNSEIRPLMAYEVYKKGEKAQGCIQLREQITAGSKMAKQIFDECFCWNEGVVLAKESASRNTMKKYDEAITLIESALAILPDSGAFYAEKGKALMGKNENDKALRVLKKGATLNKTNYKIYYLQGMAYDKLNKNDSAFESLTTAVNLSKNNFEVIRYRAGLAEKMELWNAAVFDLQQCINIRPNDATLYMKIAEIKHNKQNDLLGACEYYNAALNKGHEEAREMAGNCNNPKYMKKNLKTAGKE